MLGTKLGCLGFLTDDDMSFSTSFSGIPLVPRTSRYIPVNVAESLLKTDEAEILTSQSIQNYLKSVDVVGTAV